MARRGPPPAPLKVPRPVYRELKLLVRRRRARHDVIVRALIILAARAGEGTVTIAATVGVSSRTVQKWKARFRDNPVLAALRDGPRSGRPARVPLVARCKLIQLACERPDPKKTRFRDVWTYDALADALHRATGHRLSVSEVGRILRFEKLRPHRVQQWLRSPDPDFITKADAICDLYLSPPPGAALLCIDEKPMQALERKHPAHVGRNAKVRYEFEYIRHGTQTLLGAFNVRSGQVLGRVVARRTADATVAFMEEVARRYRQRDVYVVWDNLNTHFDGPSKRWSQFNARHGGRFHFVYTPIHASWMNQIEIWFSILHRRILKHGDFRSKRALRGRVEAFIRHWNHVECHPFRWTWRTDKLQDRGNA